MRRPNIKPPDLSIQEDGTPLRLCEYPGCTTAGEHKAPKDRSKLSTYYWFCLHHARVYNEAWDYYQGMNTAEIDQSRREDGLWNRPTWPLGGGAEARTRLAAEDARFRQAFDSFQAFSESGGFREAVAEPILKIPPEVREAFKVFGVKPSNDTMEVLKARYKALVKQYHPDHCRGDAQAEEKLKHINTAYTVLKKAGYM